MTTIQRNSASAFLGLAFGRADHDALRMPEPRVPSSICGITSLFAPRDVLRSPEGEGAPPGGDPGKTFTQADLDRIIQERVGGMKSKLDAATAALGELEGIKAKLAAADEERQAAIEAKDLEGKSELDKLKIQLQKATDKSKLQDTEWTKRVAEADARATKAADEQRQYVQRHLITTALTDAGLAKGAAKAAAMLFQSEAQLELDENHEVKSVAVGGKAHPKLGDAAKAFLADNPYFAGAPQGGSNSPKNPLGGNGGTPLEQHTSAESLIGAGLAQRSAAQS